MYLENGPFIGFKTVGGPAAPSVEASPMASVGKAHSCPDKTSNSWCILFFWRIVVRMPLLENEIVVAGIDHEAIEVQQHMLLRSDLG